MDSKDFQLLAALYRDSRQSFRSLAESTFLSAPAVRERLQRLESRGIINGYWLRIDPAIFNRDDLLVIFQAQLTREDAEKALQTPGIAWVAWKIDGGLTVQVWPKNSEEVVRDLTNTLRVSPSRQTFTRSLKQYPLSLADWRIIDSLIDDPRAQLENLCKLTGLSPKTVRKHLERLVKPGPIQAIPKPGAMADSGDVVYTLAVFGSCAMSELRTVLPDLILLNQEQQPPVKYLLSRGSDLADVTSKIGQVSKLRSVESVFVTLNREFLVATKFVHALVREQIEAWEKKRE